MFLALHGHPRVVLSFLFAAQVLLQQQFTCITLIIWLFNFENVNLCTF